MTILFVVGPLAFVPGLVDVSVYAKPTCLVVFPVSLIDVSICMDNPPLAMCLVIEVPAFVQTAIRPYMLALSLTYFFPDNPLATIFGSVLH